MLRARSGCLILVGMLVICAAGCREDSVNRQTSQAGERLAARPTSGSGKCRAGEYELKIQHGRRALLRVTPAGNSPKRALLLALHGAGSGGAPGGLWAFRGAWDLPGLAIVAPAAAGSTWTLGPIDLLFVDRALQEALRRCRVNRRRVGIGGFSAGAGLALWLGLTNGNLFDSVIALSPGGGLPEARTGRPRIFLAHGTADDVIPIEHGGDAVARDLRGDGYELTYRRFRGGHRPRQDIVRTAVRSLLLR